MNPREVIAAGIAHLSQNRLRDGLSILGIFIGIASVLCMMAIGDGARKIVAADIKKLGGANQVQFGTRISIYRKGRLSGVPPNATSLKMLLPLKQRVLRFYLHYPKMMGSEVTLPVATAVKCARM